MATRKEQTAGSIQPPSTIECLAKPENTLFTAQVLAILMVISAAIINISMRTENIELWTMVLTASLGYLMPNPKFKDIKDHANVKTESKDDIRS